MSHQFFRGHKQPIAAGSTKCVAVPVVLLPIAVRDGHGSRRGVAVAVVVVVVVASVKFGNYL